jgi:hypothetical protein
MQTAIIILGFAALGGVTLAAMRFSGTLIPPTWMALGHGAVAATGLGFLIAAATGSTVPLLVQVALGVFLLAALGGATIFVGFHLQKKPLPIPLIVLHGLTAVVGYVLLLIGAYGNP